MTTAPQSTTSAPVALAPVMASPEQQRVLERIAAQRERLADRRAARAQAQSLSQRAGLAPIPPDAPLPEKLLIFVQRHPWAVAGAVAAALMIGPSKLLRWVTLAAPLISRMRR